MVYDFETLHRRMGGGAEKWMELARSGVDDPEVIPFSVADMEFQASPEILDALKQKLEFGVFGYTIADDAYRAAVCGWLKTRHGWNVLPDWLVQTGGVVSAMGAAIRAFTQPGDKILIQPPVYPPFRHLVRKNGRTLVTNPLRYEAGQYTMDFEDLEAKASDGVKLLLLCSPHNPVGRVWTRAELEQVARICARYQILVFSDEIHFDFVYPGHAHTGYATLGEQCEQTCIIGTAASKSFNLAGLATSNIVIPNEELRKRFFDQVYLETGELNNYFGLAATQAAYEQGGPWLEELLSYLKENERLCRDFLAHYFPKVTVSQLEGTYLLWADFRSFGMEPTELERFMQKEAQLFLDEGYIFGPEGAGFERINLACPRRYLEWGLSRLKQAAEARHLI